VARDGRPLMRAIMWMDSRGAPHVGRITGGPIRVEGYGIGKLLRWIPLTGGIPLHSGKDSIAHILWLKAERPEIYREAWKFLEAMDWLDLRLTGRCASSFASIAVHWVTDNRDLARVRYHPGLLRLAGIEREQLPDLVPASSVLGPLRPEVARELALPAGVQVVVGTPDVHTAAIGSGAVRDHDANISLGTSSWVCCHVPFKKTSLLHNMASLPSAMPHRYLLLDEQESAGACLAFLKERILFPRDGLETPEPPDAYPALYRLAAGAPAGSGKVIFAPWLNGERSPVDDHRARAAFLGLSLLTTRAHLVRSVLEGVAMNSRWLMGYVEKFLKRRLEAIHLVGGGARSDLWCQIYADVLDRPIRQVKDPLQANVRGAGLIGAAAMGYLDYADVPDLVPIARTYAPAPENRAVYDELFREFARLYRTTRPIYARLGG
jgi:xylulokinase